MRRTNWQQEMRLSALIARVFVRPCQRLTQTASVWLSKNIDLNTEKLRLESSLIFEDVVRRDCVHNIARAQDIGRG
jgi:predicted SprT family Zn-dependent metalloprotease